MGYEIDFLPVGEGSRGGDAIALRFGNLFGPRNEQTVVIIDGGTKQSGSALVEHLDRYYQTDRADVVVSTHPDQDHASGLCTVLDELRVDNLLMHKPWDHAPAIRHLFQDGRLTDLGLARRMARSLQNARDLQSIAERKGIRIVEPFAGVEGYDHQLFVLGPTEDYYRFLLPTFSEMPTIRSETEELIKSILEGFREAVRWVKESWDASTETLDDTGETRPENNSSAILHFSIDGESFLFTGDAGMPALTHALDYGIRTGRSVTPVKLLQVPHHGSRRNIGPTLLDRIRPSVAYISAPPDGDPKHPSRRVVNALKRRGAGVFSTHRGAVCHFNQAPARDWGTAEQLPFFTEVEEASSDAA